MKNRNEFRKIGQKAIEINGATKAMYYFNEDTGYSIIEVSKDDHKDVYGTKDGVNYFSNSEFKASGWGRPATTWNNSRSNGEKLNGSTYNFTAQEVLNMVEGRQYWKNA